MKQLSHLEGPGIAQKQNEFITHSDRILKECIGCGICVKECEFLKKNGLPKKIAENFEAGGPASITMPFECSLCNLCTAVCPVHLEPGAMFLEMRRKLVAKRRANFKNHKSLLNYEKRGTSSFYSFFGLPSGCRTVFIPGCSLSGSRPGKVLKLFDHMAQYIAKLGFIQHCCTKPSHDLGRDENFRAFFDKIRDYLLENGVRAVLVACPSCYNIFKQHNSWCQVLIFDTTL